MRLRLVGVGVLPVLAAAMAACSSASVAPALPPVPASSSPSAATIDGQPAPTTAPSSAAAPGKCVTPAALPLRQQLGQLLMVGVDPSGTAQAKSVVAMGVGGVFVGGDATTLLTSGALQQLNESAPLKVMVAVDEEGGRVQRIDELAGSMPSARQMVATGMSVAQVQNVAAQRGQALRKYGITVDFAPDIDVSSQPNNTVIGDRSFSADPATVTAYGRAFADGLRQAGVTPVFKHFPGHGEASGDSHKGAVTTPPLTALQQRDLVPFRQLITDSPGGTFGVMVGHLDVPGLTEPDTPASLSPAAVGLLRSGSGYGAKPFQGVVFSDDLAGMAAITDQYSLPEAALAALRAGSDVALFITATRAPEVLNYLEEAVQDGRLPPAQVEQSVRRVLAAKQVSLC